jgi:hypothetical protein
MNFFYRPNGQNSGIINQNLTENDKATIIATDKQGVNSDR